jgi:diguanylate cyclase (GGDEF)-like protein
MQIKTFANGFAKASYATHLCWQASARAGVAGMRTAWRLIGLALLSYAIGDALQFVYEMSSANYPTPALSDIFFLAFYPLFLAGIVHFPWHHEDGSAPRTQALLDALTIAIGGGAVIWYFVLGPTAYSESGTLVANLVALAYPCGDLLLIAALARLWLTRKDRRLAWSLGLIAVGIAFYVVADLAYTSAILNAKYSGGTWLDSLWMLATVAFAFAALASPALGPEHDAEQIEEQGGRRRDPAGLMVGALPYLAAVVVFALLLQVHGGDPFFPNLSLTITAAVVGALLISREYVARRSLARAHARIAALATTDALTGLLNHRALAERIDRELERGRRYGRGCSLLFIDIDHFKGLNDTHGHGAGDAVLGELAELLRDSLRSVDTVGRWGGEEFVAVLPELDPDEALMAAERLRASVAAATFRPLEARMTVSIGTASQPRDGDGRAELLEAADRAMYAAKRLGRDRVFSADDPTAQAMQLGGASAVGAEQRLAEDAVDALTMLVDNRDSGTGRHAARVAALSASTAQAMGCTPAEVREVEMSGRLHDIGKVSIGDSVLRKPGRLTAQEWELMRQHPLIGADVVSRVPRLADLAPVIRSHHERFDGGGYPAGLAGEEIPLAARIISATDAFDAMTHDRPYRQALPPEEARRELRENAGTQFDPAVVDALEQLTASAGAPAPAAPDGSNRAPAGADRGQPYGVAGRLASA